MKIKEADGTIVDIFVVYWIKGSTYFYGLHPSRVHRGFLSYDPCEVSIEDSSMPFRTVVRLTKYGGGVYHWAILERNLLDDLVDADPSAYNSFVSIIKAENLVSKDFI